MGMVVRPYQFHRMDGLSEFRRSLRLGALHIPVSEDLSILTRSISIGSKVAPNSIAVQPLEGADCLTSGAPSARTRTRYERLARGGAGIIWFEACAVSEDGRDTPHQMFLHKGNVPAFASLVRAVDRAAEEAWGHRPYKVLQLTHSGRASSDRNGRPAPLAACPNPYLDPLGPPPSVVTDARLEQLEYELIAAAALAAEAGFDAVDLKLCHNYLMRELLAAFTREGPYGGSFENRTRLVRNVTAGIRGTLGHSIDLAVRINAYDAIPYPYGWGMAASAGVMAPDLSEPARLMTLLHRQGVGLFNITTMMPRCTPVGRGYLAVFEREAVISPYVGVEYLLEAARTLRRGVPGARVVATGLSWFQQFAAHVGAGGIEHQWFDIAGFGRQALADPDFAGRLLRGEGLNPGRCCVGCDQCYRLLERGGPVTCVTRMSDSR